MRVVCCQIGARNCHHYIRGEGSHIEAADRPILTIHHLRHLLQATQCNGLPVSVCRLWIEVGVRLLIIFRLNGVIVRGRDARQLVVCSAACGGSWAGRDRRGCGCGRRGGRRRRRRVACAASRCFTPPQTYEQEQACYTEIEYALQSESLLVFSYRDVLIIA